MAEAGYVLWAVARRRSLLDELSHEAPGGAVLPAACDLVDAAAVAARGEDISIRTRNLSARETDRADDYCHIRPVEPRTERPRPKRHTSPHNPTPAPTSERPADKHTPPRKFRINFG
jgi:hypothetical protein